MTSAIDPSNIDENYPVPGQPNNTQGFRDNFAGTKTNFQAAAAEISQLQQRAILKSALPGTVLDNNLSDQPLVAARIRDFSTNLVEIPTSAGVVTVDYSLGHYQRIATTGNVSLAFANLPSIESSGTVRVQFTIDQAGRTVTLPSGASGNVAYGKVGIQGLPTGSNTITFAEAGVYDFEFTAINSDGIPLINIVDCNRPLTYYTNGVGINNATSSTDVNNGALVVAGGVGIIGNINVGGSVSSSTSLGYMPGAGNVIIQNTNKSTPVTLNYICGEITTNAASLLSGTSVSFIMNNNTIANADVIILNQISAANVGNYYLNGTCNSGNARITIRNLMSSAAADAIVVRYAVIKSATS